MKTHLTAEQRATLARALQERAVALEQQLALHQQGLALVADAAGEAQERNREAAQLAGDREVDVALSQIDVRELAAIRRAQEHIHDEDYGLCADCNRAIPFARLTVEPEALRCVACESIHERSL